MVSNIMAFIPNAIAILPTLQSQDGGQKVSNMICFYPKCDRGDRLSRVGNCLVNLGKKSLIYISNCPPIIMKDGGQNGIFCQNLSPFYPPDKLEKIINIISAIPATHPLRHRPPFIIKDGGQNGINMIGFLPKFIAILPTLQSQDGGQKVSNMICFYPEFIAILPTLRNNLNVISGNGR